MSNPPTPNQQQQSDVDMRAIGPWQTWLEQFCTTHGLMPPIYSIASDRRGGRTAWSSAVETAGTSYSARFWYDGNYITNAKEDAAQVCLERLESPAEHQQHKDQYHACFQQLQAQQQQQQQQQQPSHQTDGSQQGQNMWQGYGK